MGLLTPLGECGFMRRTHEVMPSCCQFENLHHLIRSRDRPRIVQHRAVMHRFFTDLAETVAADADFGQAARQAERFDEAGDEVRGGDVRLAKSFAYPLLALGIGLEVPAQHRRQHHARGMAVWRAARPYLVRDAAVGAALEPPGQSRAPEAGKRSFWPA